MHPLPRRVLRQLLSDYGPALLEDPARVYALLADVCGQHHRERFLIVHTLRERIPQELLAHPEGGAVLWQRLSQRLQNRYGFSVEAAQWAIESWALALDIAPLKSRTLRDGSGAVLSDYPQCTLRKLLLDYGTALLNDPARVGALLADLCGPYPRERFLLVHALRERIPTELLLPHAPRGRFVVEPSTQLPGAKVYGKRPIQRLQSKYGFSTEAAQWAVESCTLAINVSPPAQDITPADKTFGPVEEIMLQILKHDPRTEAWVAAEVFALQTAKERDAAETTARQKTKERDAAKAMARQKLEERDAAETTARQKVKERKAADVVARQKAKEQAAAETMVRQKGREKAAAETTARQKEEERKAAEATVLEKAKEQAAAEATALQKAKERAEAEAAARQQAEYLAYSHKSGRMELGRRLVVGLISLGVIIGLISLSEQEVTEGALIAWLVLGLSALIGPIGAVVGLIALIRRGQRLVFGLIGLGTVIGLCAAVVEPMKVIILRLQGTLISQDGLIAQEVLIVLGALMDATLSSLTREGTLDTPIAQDMQDMPFTGLVLSLSALVGMNTLTVGLLRLMRRWQGLVVVLAALVVIIGLNALSGQSGQGALFAGLVLGLSALIGPVWIIVELIRLIGKWRELNEKLIGLGVALVTLIGLSVVIIEPTRSTRLIKLSMQIGLNALMGQRKTMELIDMMAVVFGLFSLFGMCVVIVGLIRVMRRSRMPVPWLMFESSRT